MISALYHYVNYFGIEDLRGQVFVLHRGTNRKQRSALWLCSEYWQPLLIFNLLHSRARKCN